MRRHLLIAVAFAACSSPKVEPKPLPWVNPARCVLPCTHPDESHLVNTDDRGRLGDGPWRFDRAARPALEAFLAAASAAGHEVGMGNAFRTYATQAMVWERKLNERGLGARPGHSEHELGLAVDLAYAGGAADEEWLAAHAHEHGFVLSYPKDSQRVTGFHWEPWHFRYVGTDVAMMLHQRPGLALEELFEEQPALGESGDCSDCPRPESRSTCEGLEDGGACDGEIMRWCFKGAENAVDCRLIAQHCSADAGRRVCVP